MAQLLLLLAVSSGEQSVKSGTVAVASSPIAHEILAYLVEYPEVQDTLEGIVEWWLLEQQIKHRIDQVKDALTELVAQELVLERKGHDTQIHYSLNQQKSEEIRAAVRRRKSRPNSLQ